MCLNFYIVYLHILFTYIYCLLTYIDIRNNYMTQAVSYSYYRDEIVIDNKNYNMGPELRGKLYFCLKLNK